MLDRAIYVIVGTTGVDKISKRVSQMVTESNKILKFKSFKIYWISSVNKII